MQQPSAHACAELPRGVEIPQNYAPILKRQVDAPGSNYTLTQFNS